MQWNHWSIQYLMDECIDQICLVGLICDRDVRSVIFSVNLDDYSELLALDFSN